MLVVPIHGDAADCAGALAGRGQQGRGGRLAHDYSVYLAVQRSRVTISAALVRIATASVLTAPWVVGAAHALPTDKLRRVFALVPFALAVYML